MENVVCSMFSVELSDEGKQNGRKRGALRPFDYAQGMQSSGQKKKQNELGEEMKGFFNSPTGHNFFMRKELLCHWKLVFGGLTKGLKS